MAQVNQREIRIRNVIVKRDKTDIGREDATAVATVRVEEHLQMGLRPMNHLRLAPDHASR